MNAFSDGLKKLQVKNAPRKGPLWKGPLEDGITFSLLSRYLVCPERFRIHAIEGLRPAERWNHRLGYGSMWHACEEAIEKGETWEDKLLAYTDKELRKFPLQQDTIAHWYSVCEAQFPVYLDYWAEHEDEKKKKNLLKEVPFAVKITLPSGRKVKLRGKWDSVDQIEGPYWVQENKTKGDIDEMVLRRQLTFDLQTMIYVIAFREKFKQLPFKGVRYNVIRRPLSGGKGSIVQHKPSKKNPQGETAEHYYQRLKQDYIEKEPETYFMRWNVGVDEKAITKFKQDSLFPILEQLCWWYDNITKGGALDRYPPPPCHYRLPFGIYNPLLEGNVSDTDEYLATGNRVGLHKIETLFPELETAA